MGFKQRVYQSVGGSLVALTMVISPALAEELDNWSFDTTTNELTFSLSDTVLPEFFLLAEPPRLVLDIPDTQMGTVESEQRYDGAVQTIRVAQHTPDHVRVVIELAPDSLLAPDQADIQFDDSHGQRHWRFRPLLTDSTVATVSPTSTSSPSTTQERLDDTHAAGAISLSAANLDISEQSTGTTLPIDPYVDEVSPQVISVPPLEDIPDSVDVTSAPEQAAVVPDLPSMTVPELEQPEIDSAVVTSEIESPEVVRAGLPALADSDDPLEPTVQSDPQAAVADAVPDVAVPDVEESVDTAVAIVPDAAVTRSEILAVPPSSADTPSPEGPKKTALAPVAHPSETQQQPHVEESSEQQTWQTIQQPAAERTIVQIDIPAPLTFGQPLPSAAD